MPINRSLARFALLLIDNLLCRAHAPIASVCSWPRKSTSDVIVEAPHAEPLPSTSMDWMQRCRS